MTNAPSTPLSARSMAAESFQSPSTSSTPWFAQLDAFSRLRTNARTSLPRANRCSAVAPPTFPVIPITKNMRSEEHTSELQSRQYLVCRLLLEKKKQQTSHQTHLTT